MTLVNHRFWLVAALAAGGALPACAAGTPAGELTGSGGGSASASGIFSSSSASSGEGGSISVGAGSGSGGAAPASFVVYAHTNKTLFRVDPTMPSLPPVQIGDFDCIGGPGQDTSMTDLAVNQQGDLWSISTAAVYHLVVQGSVVHCASTIPLNNAQQVKFYALTFVPAGVLDPAKEVLVAGNSAGELWAVDDKGGLTLHGNFGLVPADDGNGHTYATKNKGKRWELSGDIVFLANAGSPVGFATVRDCPQPPSTTGCNTTDTLIQIDVAAMMTATTQPVTKSVRGEIVKRAGCSDKGNPGGYGSMFGVAAWNDKVYGFAHAGALVEISNNDGTACLVHDEPTDLWDGAGVTTVAPVDVPPPK